MNLSNGRTYLAIPGPSVVPDRVLNAMHQAAPNIYAGPLYDVVDDIYRDLKVVAKTKGKVAIYIGNGHAAWEAALVNCFSKGDKILSLVTGAFGMGWAEAAMGLGIAAETLDFGKRNDVDLDQVETTLRHDKTHEIKAITVVHTDTATTVRNDIAALRRVMDDCGHPSLLMVDAIASLACDPMEMDAWGVDVMVAASQKGLMTPPGISFVYFSEKADALHQLAGLVTPYWNWTPRTSDPMFYRKFCGTAPTHHLLGLHEALKMLIHEEGLENALNRHAVLARTVWAALEKWGEKGPVELNIVDPSQRSHAVTSVRIAAPLGTDLRSWVEENTGVTLGIGLGMALPDDPAWHGFFRIGHMGHLNAHMVLGVLGSIDAGLKALAIPHGEGALDAATAVIAGSYQTAG